MTRPMSPIRNWSASAGRVTLTDVTRSAVLTELVDLPGGPLRMGSDQHYPEEAPARDVVVAPFKLERHPVTNAQFAAFVADTGYVTVAEQSPDPANYPGADASLLVPGGLVFTPTAGPVPLDRWDQWWRWVPGASWRHPRGPGSDVSDRSDHPVVMVAYDDAVAYAAWSGRRLPTEPELEFAAGAFASTEFAWGDELSPGGELMANTWQGQFPWRNTGAKGWVGTSPVGSFPANPWGLVDLIGNVWEWTSTYYVTTGADRGRAEEIDESSCCAPRIRDLSVAPGELHPRRVLKGGSHLCAPEYCRRYRPAARSGQSVDSATSHVGFRCAITD